MKIILKTVSVLVLLICMFSAVNLSATEQKIPQKILVVSSYHPGYLWSRETNKGFCAAMIEVGFFDNQDQADEYTRNDFVESSTVRIKKLWMDSKRHDNQEEIKKTSLDIYKQALEFGPDLIFLGDDNAANYIGNQFLDTNVPVVFWGVNNTPVKYGLIDSMEHPGHNVTGVYQSGYYVDSLNLLKKIAPQVKTFATLSVQNPTGRSYYKALEHLERNGELPVKLVSTIATNDYEEFQKEVLELQDKVDAFYLASPTGFHNKDGVYVSLDKVMDWYRQNVRIPDATGQGHYLELGVLCAAVDSGFNQAYEAVKIADAILNKGADPASIAPITPQRGPLVVNTDRARMLGITLTPEMGIEKYVTTQPGLKE